MRTAVLFAVLLSTSAASATEYTCPSRISYPEWGADHIPTNANSIEINLGVDPMFKATSLGTLDPDSHYELHEPVYLDFKTGKGPDLHVPSAPLQLRATITVTSKHVLNTAALDGLFDQDAPFIEIEVKSKAGGAPLHFGMSRNDRLLCCINYGALEPGPATVTVWSWTPAAHSDPVSVDTVIAVDDTDLRPQACPEHHYKCGMGATMLMLMIPPVVIAMLIGFVVIALLRRSRANGQPGEVISPLLAESVAQVVKRGYSIKSAVAVLSTIALLAADYQITAILIGPFALVWLLRLNHARRIVSRLEAPVDVLERREDWLVINTTLLYCGRRAWKRAARVPMASVTVAK